MNDTTRPIPKAESATVEIRIGEHHYALRLPDAGVDYIQTKIRTEGQPYELELLEDIRERVKPDDLVLDVGANVGNHSLFLAAVAGCRVMAFEPNAHLCEAIRESIALNGLVDRVQVRQNGVGRGPGHARFEKERPDNLGAQSLALGSGDIEVVALDDLSFDAPVRVIKVDVEGMELDVIEGALGLIRRDRPILYVECITEAEFRTITRRLETLGYAYWDTFSATPTHLFQPQEMVGIDDRLAKVQSRLAQESYRGGILLREIRVRLTQAQERERALQQQLGAANDRLRAANSDLAGRSAELALRQAEVRDLAMRLQDHQSRLIDLSKDHGVAEGRLDELAKRFETLSNQRVALERSNRELADRNADLEHRASNLASLQAATSAQLELTRKALAEGEQQVVASEERLAESVQRLADSERRMADSEQRLAAVRAEYASLQAHAAHLSATVEEARQKVEDLGHEVADRQRATEAVRLEANSAKSRLARAQQDLSRRDAKLVELQREQKRLQRALEVKTVRAEALERRSGLLTERLERTKSSTSFKVGAAVVDGARSLPHALRLPLELWALFRESRQRRSDRSAQRVAQLAQEASSTETAPSKPSRAELSPPAVKASAPPRAEATKAKPVQRVAPETTPGPRKATPFPGQVPHNLKDLRVAGVMDEFTFHSFHPECELHALKPEEWQRQLESIRPHLVFIESAWRGVDGLWTAKVSNPSPEIMGLIAWCRAHSVPTVFWNKEDPVHFGGFQHIARAVDHVFTTDIDCIAKYKREIGHDRVYLLPFAAQPAAHNPIEQFDRIDGFCFAGSYYLRYPERQRDFRNLIDVVREMRPVEIFDRNFHNPHPHYEFPPEYRPLIVGSLPFDQIDRAYKGYRFGINMNTIKQSQTMFARRVFELLASNTVVVSNFSRGVRLLFGDLVISSDESVEIRRRLDEVCADESRFRRFRLAGLRKVLGQHTYAQRLAYLVAKVSGTVVRADLPSVCVVAQAESNEMLERLIEAFRRQSAQGKHLCVIAPASVQSPADSDVTVVANLEALRQHPAYAASRWVSVWSTQDHHGPNYLLDLLLATTYSPSAAIGKAASFVATPQGLELRSDGTQYTSVSSLPLRTSIVGRQLLDTLPLVAATDLETARVEQDGLLAIDEFNYAQGTGLMPSTEVTDQTDDLPGLRTGLRCDSDLLARAEAIRAASPGQAVAAENLPTLGAAQLAELFPTRRPAGVRMAMVGDVLQVRCTLDAEAHRYLYCDRVFSRAELNLELNSRVQLFIDGKLDLRTVFEFLDEDHKKISHAMTRAGAAHSLAIPARCQWVRFGLRFEGKGVANIKCLVLGDARERPSTLLAAARHLVVLKQYPAYRDLYRYGFAHSRVRAYRASGLPVDVFRLVADEPGGYREFENVDLTTGDRDLLDLALRSGQYGHVAVHLLDASMWEVLERHIDRVKVTVWVHGAEIQTWQRRAFEFETLDAEEIARKKALSDQRAAFWARIVGQAHPNLTLVFVSNYLAEQAQADLGLDLQRVRHEVIHNHIDGNLFRYEPKEPGQRLHVLTIRPFASRVYGNDLTVKSIELLSRKPFFSELSFRIVGDGELFEETTRPLLGFENVTLDRRFLTQREIAALHREHGIFLCPTRMDTQGVSRDEAMASGLVPVTSRVAAVPEFVDNDCGVLADPESAEQLADAIEALYHDPARFQRLSVAAAQRVRHESAFEDTIGRELRLLRN